jgi:cbb3-type cytochrome oxidase subunit 3
MEEDKSYIEEQPVSLAEVIINIKAWITSMFKSWRVIFLGTFLIGGLYFTYQTLRKINYTAETRFVLETEGAAGGLGGISSLANLAGVNLGGISGGSSLFQLDNIVELYRSYTMMKKTLLTESNSDFGSERLITWYGREHKVLKKWNNLGIDFEIPEAQMIVRHDSLLKEVVEDILEKSLDVSKPSRKLSILKVAYTANDEIFAQTFNEVLVGHVNDFYLKVKTQKTGENLRVLSFQSDSVKKVLDKALLDLAIFAEQNPNLNPLRAQSLVPGQKIQIDLQASSAVYQELVKNLEIAKITHRNNTPLIQIIDAPVLPLADDRMKWYKALVFGLILGGVLMVGYLTLKGIYQSIMEEQKSRNFI